MIRLCIYVFFLAATLTACAGEQNSEEKHQPQPQAASNDIVARIGSRTVSRNDLRCPPHIAVEQCAPLRQAKFDQRAREMLIEAAAHLHGVRVPEQVVKDRMPELKDDELRAADEAYKRYARAALRVRQGEDKDLVYRQDLAPHGVRVEQFESALRTLPDLPTVQRALTLDVAEHTRRQFADETRRRLILEQLGTVVHGRRRDGVSFEVAADRFWNDVINKTGTVVLDPSLQMPRMEGVLKP